MEFSKLYAVVFFLEPRHSHRCLRLRAHATTSFVYYFLFLNGSESLSLVREPIMSANQSFQIRPFGAPLLATLNPAAMHSFARKHLQRIFIKLISI